MQSTSIHLGVVGAGQMGRGIAQVAAQSGCEVTLSDADLERAQSGVLEIEKSLNKLVAKQKLGEPQKDQILARLRAVGANSGHQGATVVVEAATENEKLKTKIFQELDEVLGPDTILATNTSSISITRLGGVTSRPEKVIGMHFMNPVPLMSLVEVIRGIATDEATYKKTRELAELMGKTVVTSSDYPGFIVNRILMPMINEAIYAVMEGVASPEDIDAAMRLGTNQPMGPLVLADFIGLDTCLAIMEVLHEGYGDSKYRPCPLLRKMVDSGRLGRKTGQGFHSY
tara:strand:- start:452 stop:1306 length:855 start_codon:yes stop_codon:yes gene_type:complete